MHEHVPSAYGTAGKLTDLRVDCSFSGRIWYRGLHGFQGFVHRDCCGKDFCMYSRLPGLMHVQTARTHAYVDVRRRCMPTRSRTWRFHGLVRRSCIDSYRHRSCMHSYVEAVWILKLCRGCVELVAVEAAWTRTLIQTCMDSYIEACMDSYIEAVWTST